MVVCNSVLDKTFPLNRKSKAPSSFLLQIAILKGRWPESQRSSGVPVKTSGNASFYGEKLQCGRYCDRLERDYVIYVHIDVNLDGRGGFAAARSSIVRKEIGGTLA